MWVLSRLGALDHSEIHHLVQDADGLVRVHLLKAIGEQHHWDSDQHSVVRKMLGDSDPFVRRTAAEVLGLHPDLSNIDARGALADN